MVRSLPKPPLTPLQLYRHILREVSYLPPAVRPTFDHFIRLRFHQHRFDRKDGRTPGHLRKAWNTLRSLKSANNGDKITLTALLQKGFGRAGIRKYRLMSEFVPAQAPADTKVLEALISQAQNSAVPNSKSPSPRFFDRWDREKLLSILRSQKAQQEQLGGTMSWPGAKVKSLNPDVDVPDKNIWGKPPAESLCQTKRARWWKRAAEKVMPPLAKGEWELLERLSRDGQEGTEWAVPARRAPAVLVGQSTGESSSWNWEVHANYTTALAEVSKSLLQQRRTGHVDRGPYSVGDRTRTLTPRFYKRTYGRIWATTPKMEQNPKTLKHMISWGSASRKLPTPTEQQQAIFDGVDNKGQKTSKPKS